MVEKTYLEVGSRRAPGLETDVLVSVLGPSEGTICLHTRLSAAVASRKTYETMGAPEGRTASWYSRG